MKRLILVLGLLTASGFAQFSLPPIRVQSSDPANCTTTGGIGELKIYYNTSTSSFKFCSAANTWSPFTSSPFASGGTTNNVIPKSNGSSALADSSITDNGTNVISPEGIIGVAGTASVPTYAYTGATNYGSAFSAGSGGIVWSMNGNLRYLFVNSEIRSGASSGFTFSSNNDPTAASADTSVTRGGAGIVNVGNSATSGSQGTVNLATMQYRGLAQTTFVTSDFTTSGVGTALEAITGLTWTFPATTAINARIDCNILYLQNVANVAVAFGFQDATVAPTNLAASGIQYTSATASTEGTLAASATTTATAVTSATPSAITTIWHAQLHFLVEQPSNASTSVFTIRVSTATAADTVTVKRGSYCSLAQ